MILIPKVFHRVWLGEKPIPPQYEIWGQSWLDKNPGWLMRTWREKDFQPINQDALKSACHLSQQSNIYRYEILAIHGGVYVDTDFECLKPINVLLHDIAAFASYKKHENILMSAILGCVPSDPWMRDLANSISVEDSSTSLSLGSSYVTKITQRHPHVYRFASEVFCPVSSVEIPYKGEEVLKKTPPETAFGRHHWTSLTNPIGFKPLKSS